jgi:hypothetical protein
MWQETRYYELLRELPAYLDRGSGRKFRGRNRRAGKRLAKGFDGGEQLQYKGNEPRHADEAKEETHVEAKPLCLPWSHCTPYELYRLYVQI